jgi:hypothetical protein
VIHKKKTLAKKQNTEKKKFIRYKTFVTWMKKTLHLSDTPKVKNLQSKNKSPLNPKHILSPTENNLQ